MGADVIVLPEHAVRQAITEGHAEYLRLQGGNRPITGASTHFAARDRMVDPLRRSDITNW